MKKNEMRRLRAIRVPKEIVIPWFKDLDEEHLQLLAICLWCIRYGSKFISRRSFVDIAADVLRNFEGVLLNPDGSVLEIADLDEALGGPHFDWLRQLFALPLGDEWIPNKQTKFRLRVVLAVIKAGGPALWRGLLEPYKIDD
ncbi:hypothetical protein QMT40_000393 [Parvibaculaceae bacterium PLY_AMNH_Bact1]|nr:hypothetical protein QMT40_000393 [Parvibaculaceae bacterium PLY_AMNH_Bact1]